LSDKYVGDQLTVVDQVARSMAGQGLVDKRRDLEQEVAKVQSFGTLSLMN